MVVVLPDLLRRLLLLETVLLLYQHRLALRLDHCYVTTTCATPTRRFQLLLQLGLTAHVEVRLLLRIGVAVVACGRLLVLLLQATVLLLKHS